ncbi:MAG: hypothetical protein IPL61_32210 [Myxococcales bacterium]|nr:hypothetical protein [Myxococcales bacterium]
MAMRHSVVVGAIGEAYDDVDDLLHDCPDLEDTIALIEGASQWIKTVGRELQATAPGALQGALTGFMAGGPAGAAAGAVIGGVGSRLGAAPAAGAPTTASVGNAAAIQLLAAILRPEVIQALGAMALGSSGAASVPVAGTPVPVAAFANMLGTLANQAAAQHHATLPPAAVAPAYSAGATAPRARAEALVALLADAADDDLADVDEFADVDDSWSEAMAQRDLEDIDRLEAE